MISPLCFPNLSYPTFLSNNLNSIPPLTKWFAFGKLPENPVVTPTSSVQVVRPSAENKFLESVTVEAIPTAPGA